MADHIQELMIYVDKLFVFESLNAQAFRTGAQFGHKWCHMWCDGDVGELHAMADRIGLKRTWFQDKPGFAHYDLVPPRREAALERGAVEMDLRDWLRGKRAAIDGQTLELNLGL